MSEKTYVPFWEEQAEALGGRTDRQPISQRLRAQLGEWSFAQRAQSVGGNPVTDRLAEIANRVARPANVVRNTDQGEERVLKIGWSDGSKVNKPDDDTVWLSPDAVLKSRINTMGEDEIVDAMTGAVLLGGTMKRTISMESWERAVAEASTPESKPAITIWQAFESAIARADVLKNWPGCADYFKRHAQKNCASKAEVQKALDTYKPSVELAAAALSWNIQFPANKLTLSPRYQKAIDLAVKYLDREHEPSERYELCRDVAKMLAEALNNPPEDGGEQGGNDSEGSSNKDKSDEQGKDGHSENREDGDFSGDSAGGDDKRGAEDSSRAEAGGDPGEPNEHSGEDGAKEPEGADKSGSGKDGASGSEDDAKPEGPAPEVTDGSLFGEEIQTKRVKPDFLPPSQEVNAEGDPSGEISMPEGLCKHHSTTVFLIEESNGTWFNTEARAMASQVRAIQNALRFRNNDLTLFNRGCTSGDLDEGSLDKLSLNEQHPAIWERRELAGQPKVAVGILLDESGSMMGNNKLVEAQRVCVAMAAALGSIRGVSTMLLGHSGDGRPGEYSRDTKKVQTTQVKGEGRQVNIYEYLTTKHKNPYAIQHARCRGNNYDSFALDYAVRKMVSDYPSHERRVMFLVSDGYPAGAGDGDLPYGGVEAMKHVRQVCEWGRRHKVMVCGIGIRNAYDAYKGEMMFGKGNFVVINDVMSSLSILTAFLKQVAARA